MMNRAVKLVSRPVGPVSPSNFTLTTSPLPETVPEGHVIVKNHFLSLDPYMRGRLNDAKSYASPQALNETMQGGTVGRIFKSTFPGLEEGEWVKTMGGWQEYSVLPGKAVSKIKVGPNLPSSAFLGVIGMPGVTAYYGVKYLLEPKQGETIVVSAATGAVGSCAGQIAKQLFGCRVVGIAGGKEKCDIAVKEFGYDACVDYKAFANSKDLQKAIHNQCPNGIDGVFENVGGDVFNAVLPEMNPFGRVAVCGWISGYQATAPTPLLQPNLILTLRLKIAGFIISEQKKEIWDEALSTLEQMVASGKLKYKETVAQGLEKAPEAFISLLTGGNVGKQLVAIL